MITGLSTSTSTGVGLNDRNDSLARGVCGGSGGSGFSVDGPVLIRALDDDEAESEKSKNVDFASSCSPSPSESSLLLLEMGVDTSIRIQDIDAETGTHSFSDR